MAMRKLLSLFLLASTLSRARSALPPSSSLDDALLSLRGGSLFIKQQSNKDDDMKSRLASLSFGGKACPFYLWDAPSALLHKWCHHLMRDCVYEGRGGHKFVRIPQGSILQLLYPCSRFSPDRCLICGGNFQDHLTLWWSKHLYSPYDQVLDKIYQDGVVVPTEASTKKKQGWFWQTTTASSKEEQPETEFCFHRSYVLDKRRLPKELARRKQDEFPKSPVGSKLYERSVEGVSYLVPGTESNRRLSFTLIFFREAILSAVDRLIFNERVDQINARRQRPNGKNAPDCG